MSTPFLGEIRIFSFTFPPRNWAFCNGQSLPVNQNQGLYSLLGNVYGGNAVNFLLPNLQGRVPMHVGPGFPLGQAAGSATHVLSLAELPAHQHALRAVSGAGGQRSIAGNMLGESSLDLYGSDVPSGTMDATALANVGGGASHSNVQPYLGINFCIALAGVFPS